jgi:CheY-like chemotaxis protein
VFTRHAAAIANHSAGRPALDRFPSPGFQEPAGASAENVTAPQLLAAERLRVLVVEDNLDAARSLQDLVECIGYEAAVATTGDAGVATALEFLPHVVLCDIGLPGRDGYSVAEALKQDARTSAARLIAVSGYGREEDLRHSREAGFEAHLVKPIDLDLLEELLARAAAELAAPKRE